MYRRAAVPADCAAVTRARPQASAVAAVRAVREKSRRVMFGMRLLAKAHYVTLPRMMKRSVLLGMLVAAGTMSIAVGAFQQPPAAAQGPRAIDSLKLNDNLYVLTSSTPGDQATFSGGNVAVFITDQGVTLVDTKLAAWGPALLDAIKRVTSKPVTRIINTHTHGDHTGNDDKFGATVDIVAHENTKANMAKMPVFQGEKAQFLPKNTYKDKMSIGSGKDRIDLYYFGAGHTNGDTFIVFPALRVLHTGDMFAWKYGPFCDRSNG